jgi:hypothetical protein
VPTRLIAAISLVVFPVIATTASLLGQAEAASLSETYASLALSIETARGQGLATLNQGRFAGNDGDIQFAIINRNGKELSFKFDYQGGAIYSGTLDFKTTPIVVVASKNDLCAAVEIQLIIIRPGGFLDEANSKFRVITNHPDCRNPKFELAGAVAQLFRLPLTPSPFFQASWFKWQATTERCLPERCAGVPDRRAASIFKEIVFFPDARSRRIPLAPGLEVSFADHGSIDLGRGDFLLLASGSRVVFAILSIDVEKQAVTARMKNVTLNLTKGIISAASMQFNLGSGSKLEASNFDIDGKDKTVTFKGTNISGFAESGTTLKISHGPTLQESSVTFAGASVALNSIDLEIRQDYVKFSAASGRFESAVQDADLRLGRGLRLFLGAANFNITFRCPVGSPANCRPLVAETGQPMLTVGEIDPLTVTSKAGWYEAPSVGIIRLDRCEVSTGALEFDSRKVKGPIWGNVKRVALDVSAQRMQLNPGLQLGATSGRLRGEDLTISSNDSIPVGDLDMHVEISEFLSEGLGRFATIRGSSKMDALLRRTDGADIHILNGSIEAAIIATTDGGNVQARLAVSALDLFQGNGGAQFTLVIPPFTYSRTIPGQEEKDGSLAEVIVTSHLQVLTAKLTREINLDRRQITIRSGKWSIERTTFALQAALSLSDKTLVDAQVEIGGVHVCEATVNLPFSDYIADFTGELAVHAGNLRFRSTPFVINPYPQPSIDGKSCQRAATLICGLAGGVLGPIGTVGVAYFCNQEFSKGEKELQDKLNEMVRDGIASTRFDIGS